uniref:Uncharacterized protein n=1 Tax=Escherichia coli TaxID=562 RepID=A0A220SXN0_ECOLX|nr:hypothetical protein [Escherichia coli]
MTPAAKSFVAGTSLPWTTETGCGRVCTPGKSVCGEQAAVRRQTGKRQLRHQAQWPYTP